MLLNQALGLPIKQSEVDFVIPNLDEDLNLYIDPFLFYKSNNPEYQAVHATIREFFSIAIAHVRDGKPDIAKRMLQFPEVNQTMLGLSTGSHRGRGLGDMRGGVIFQEIISNPDIQKNGIKHLAEMQLLIEGVGFDMISDMCTNIAKPYLVRYTQLQAILHGIPLESGVALTHVFDWDEQDWDDIHTNLPVNPRNGNAMLFVPKAVVRLFTEIDYKDFWKTTYRYILRDIESSRSLAVIGREPKITWKEIDEKYDFCKKTVVEVLHAQPDLKRQYLDQKENETLEIVMPLDLSLIEGTDRGITPIEDLISELQQIDPGNKDAKKYEQLIVRVLTRLFSPPLIDPHSQVTTSDGREIIDITFYNGANQGFWQDVKSRYDSHIIVFELKNMTDLGNEEYFQIAARLDTIRGMFGILIARDKDNLDVQRARRRLDKERKLILTLTDRDIVEMLQGLESGLPATLYLNRMYRKFIEEA